MLAIGGLKEKTIAAYRYGITTVVIPEENRRDLEEIPEKVKTGLKFVFAKTADTAVLTALCPAEGKTAEKKEAGKRSLPVLPRRGRARRPPGAIGARQIIGKILKSAVLAKRGGNILHELPGKEEKSHEPAQR